MNWILPGWTCKNLPACGVFNSSMKSELTHCRCCGHARFQPEKEGKTIDRAASSQTEINAAIHEAVKTGDSLTIMLNGIPQMLIAARRPLREYDDEIDEYDY